MNETKNDTNERPKRSATAACSPDKQETSDEKLYDFIGSIRDFDYVERAKLAVCEVSDDDLKEAWNWTATYLVELEERLQNL